jgi:hypothetical protein
MPAVKQLCLLEIGAVIILLSLFLVSKNEAA